MLLRENRRTNVVWSFEAKCLTDQVLKDILEEDVDALRLASGHNDLPLILEFIKKLRQQSNKGTMPLPILVDLLSKERGSLKNLAEPREVLFGQQLTFGKSGSCDFTLETDSIADLFTKGAAVYLGSGSVVLEVLQVQGETATLEVRQGGVVLPDMEVHVPSTRQPARLNAIDERSLKAICDQEVEFVVVPGFENADELVRLNTTLETIGKGRAPWVILKLSSESVCEKLDELLPHVRGVLIARVDLAMATDPASVPMLTKEIIQKCNQQSKIVLVASEILSSMRHNATPTRAEVSDIANAVFDGADGVVLSEDLAYGKYARRGLMLARKTIEDVEKHGQSLTLNWAKDQTPVADSVLDTITYSAYKTAHRIGAKAIVCITKTGNTALHLSAMRSPIQVIAVTQDIQVLRRLKLVRGVNGFVLHEYPNIDEVLQIINSVLVQDKWLKPGDRYVFVSVTLSSVEKEGSNLFTVQTVV